MKPLSAFFGKRTAAVKPGAAAAEVAQEAGTTVGNKPGKGCIHAAKEPAGTDAALPSTDNSDR